MVEELVIIGAGEAGTRTALHLKELGYQGKITLVGNEPFLPYERPPLSKSVLVAESSPETPKLILSAQNLVFQGIEFLPNVQASRIDRASKAVILENGKLLNYSKLLIATGATSRKLPSDQSLEVFYLRSFAEALKLRNELRPATELIVIGAGFIGLEIAASAVARGCKVTILEMASTILSRSVPAVVAKKVFEGHIAAGVEIMTSIVIKKIFRLGSRTEVWLNDGRKLFCDILAAGIGAIPSTSLAEASDIDVENGIRVDEFLCTSDPHIYAAGDCCSFPHPLYDGKRIRLEAWRNAQDQAIVAAVNMLGGKRRYEAVPWFWSDQYDETLQVTGLFSQDCLTTERQLENASIYFHTDAKGKLIAASAMGPNASISKEIRVAEMLIAQRYIADTVQLANPAFKLKELLKRTV